VISYFGEVHKFQISERKLVRKIFAPKRDEVSEEQKILQNKELYCL
jgi:hypothetical protein